MPARETAGPGGKGHPRGISIRDSTKPSIVVDGDDVDQFGGAVWESINDSSIPAVRRICTLDIHDASSSRADILINFAIFPEGIITEGDLLQVLAIEGSSHRRYLPDVAIDAALEGSENGCRLAEADVDMHNAYVFYARAMPPEILGKHPNWEVSVSAQALQAFRLVRGGQVMVCSANLSVNRASHIEIVFRDQYLARADMWRLVNAELAGQCLYKGQKILFMESIRATVRTIFLAGRKTHSAVFGPSTKPIFRSESARYVMFIQMSKEMWDFDAEGSGEIMFDKVINGFLPELFKRWQQAQVRHLVTIVLFTRMIYDSDNVSIIDNNNLNEERNPSFKDFYRVVVSDMASADSAKILQQLKKEFKVFLRDVSIQVPSYRHYAPLGYDPASDSVRRPGHLIAGRPSTASQGNVLEAINLASSQFSADYIDRDLVRTGVSIVVISPGTGIFNVDYSLLVATTDNLIDNGVGIDLVCLSRMPLHSVPLFRYKQPSRQTASKPTQKILNPSASFNSSVSHSFGTPSPSSLVSGLHKIGSRPSEAWRCGIPHWIDISFWTSADADSPMQLTQDKAKSKTSTDTPQYKPFVPRVKMYDLQMMGVTDASAREVQIPRLMVISGSFPSQSDTSRRSAKVDNTLAVSPYGSVDRMMAINVKKPADLASSPKSARPFMNRLGDSVYSMMDEYDEALFSHPRATRKRRSRLRSKQRWSATNQSLLSPQRIQPKKPPDTGSAAGPSSHDETLLRGAATKGSGAPAKGLSLAKSPVSRASDQTPRSISIGLRPFTPQAVVSAKVDNTPSTEWTTRKGRIAAADTHTVNDPSSRNISGLPDATETIVSTLRPISDTDSGVLPSSDSEHQISSRPILIKGASSKHHAENHKYRKDNAMPSYRLSGQPYLTGVTDLRAAQISLIDDVDDEQAQEVDPILSPNTILAPWLTVLNPCNPNKLTKGRSNLLGRWQHVFPRPPKTSQIKWKSLCAPAAVPITTEDFPTSDQLEEEYKKSSYVVTLPEEMDLSEHPRSTVNEILAFRLSRGFQIITGDRLTATVMTSSAPDWLVFNERALTNVGSTVYLSRGSTIHRLTRSSIDRLEIEISVRHSRATSDVTKGDSSMNYRPVIRSMLADTYEPQVISLLPQRGSFNWDMIDAYIAGHERPEAAQYVENLRPWRARFVLIPVEAPSSARRMLRSNEDSDEEIRLEGIKRLTQLWQRFRYLQPEERHFQTQIRRSKDPNPLDITYQTKDPSAIVAAELEASLEGAELGAPIQLLPEPELFQRVNLNVKALADTLQSEKGVHIYNRRWHWRLHYNCFTGVDLTTWLLQNFRDVDTREEAEVLGKDLMKKGLFRHVDTRHDFRDGNYFYQIVDEYRTARTESKGWFGRGKSSVPATPVAGEAPSSELPRVNRSRASSSADTGSETQNTRPAERKPKLGVALSKSLFYDVDHRKRSYRPELINLHYDRLHNPDSCYHIRVEWMNTTPKLIQEAVVSWATQVDRFGLRLVEVPIGEASSITSMHPFRAPYQIGLCRPPPAKQPQVLFDVASFPVQSKPDALFYQKAILKHFNFVLDYEAASSFPADVDVSYSWGKPDYRYPQYIHRSGALIAQITDDGHFLILANRLYNNRSAAQGSDKGAAARERLSDYGPMWSPHRGGPATQTSPGASPSIRAALNVPPAAMTNRKLSPTQAASDPAKANTPEQITREFQTFCNDAPTLDAFYAEILTKATTPASTPRLGGKTPLRTPLKTPSRWAEGRTGGEGLGEIPSLMLPGSLVEAKGGGKGR